MNFDTELTSLMPNKICDSLPLGIIHAFNRPLNPNKRQITYLSNAHDVKIMLVIFSFDSAPWIFYFPWRIFINVCIIRCTEHIENAFFSSLAYFISSMMRIKVLSKVCKERQRIIKVLCKIFGNTNIKKNVYMRGDRDDKVETSFIPKRGANIPSPVSFAPKFSNSSSKSSKSSNCAQLSSVVAVLSSRPHAENPSSGNFRIGTWMQRS